MSIRKWMKGLGFVCLLSLCGCGISQEAEPQKQLEELQKVNKELTKQSAQQENSQANAEEVTKENTETPEVTITSTPVPTVTSESTSEPESITTVTNTPIPASTSTPTPTLTATPLPTATSIPSPTSTPKPTETPIATVTSTPKPTATPIPTATNTSKPTATPIPTAISTPKPTATPRPTTTPTPTPTFENKEFANFDVTYNAREHAIFMHGIPKEEIAGQSRYELQIRVYSGNEVRFELKIPTSERMYEIPETKTFIFDWDFNAEITPKDGETLTFEAWLEDKGLKAGEIVEGSVKSVNYDNKDNGSSQGNNQNSNQSNNENSGNMGNQGNTGSIGNTSSADVDDPNYKIVLPDFKVYFNEETQELIIENAPLMDDTGRVGYTYIGNGKGGPNNWGCGFSVDGYVMEKEHNGFFMTERLTVNGDKQTIIIASYSEPKNKGGSYTMSVWIEALDTKAGKTLTGTKKKITFRYKD